MPFYYIYHFPKSFSQLEVNTDILVSIKAVEKISKKNKNTYACGKDPMGLEPTVLYIACASDSNRKSQKEIADAASQDNYHIARQIVA